MTEQALTEFKTELCIAIDGENSKQMMLEGNILTSYFKIVIYKNEERQKQWFHVTQWERAYSFFKQIQL